MPAHFQQCLLISLLYYLPSVLMSRTHVNLYAPSSVVRCSLDDLVNRLTLEDLARLVSRWSLREGVSTVRVLHMMENGISTSEEIHRATVPIRDNGDHFLMPLLSKSRDRESSLNNQAPEGFLAPVGIQMPTMQHVPIGSHGLPQPPLPNIGFRVPANFPHLPPPFGQASMPSSLRQPPGMRQQIAPVMPFETLRPPPDAIVRIEDTVFGSSLPEVPVTVSPRMPITEALLQAAADNSPPGGQFNPYKITWGQNSNHPRCLIVRAVGNLGMDDGEPFVWEIFIKDRTGQEIWRGVCLPSLDEVHIKPGMTITLNYVKQEAL